MDTRSKKREKKNSACLNILPVRPVEIKDKKDYLHEELKPVAHRNKPHELFHGLFFTSKNQPV